MGSRASSLLIWALAAVFEAVGDAIQRTALRSSHTFNRLALFLTGACVLFAYGCIVNAPAWNFGQLLGIYIVFFFILAQVNILAGFRAAPSRALVLGGALIVSGGIVIAFGDR